MVNVIIYLNKDQKADALVEQLLKEELFALATIDKNNVSYKFEDGAMKKKVYTVVTAQSKSLLFPDIVKSVKMIAGENTPVYSVPIINSNESFFEWMKTNTRSI